MKFYHYATSEFDDLRSRVAQGKGKLFIMDRKPELLENLEGSLVKLLDKVDFRDEWSYDRSISLFIAPLPLDIANIYGGLHELWKSGEQFVEYDGLIVLCGRYEGVDERLIQQYVDQEWSIGDYVLSGGELPAMVLLDSIIRRLPGTMSDEQSAIQDSFVDGLLDCPQYTKPDHFQGLDVPEVLKSGHHANIEKWRFLQRYQRTLERRPELVEKVELTKLQKKWLKDLNT